MNTFVECNWEDGHSMYSFVECNWEDRHSMYSFVECSLEDGHSMHSFVELIDFVRTALWILILTIDSARTSV